jgi:hypothetical protein
MTLGRFAAVFALVSILCVLTVFLFPALQGPYSAVHGPVTAFQSARAAAGVRTAMVRAGLKAISRAGREVLVFAPVLWVQFYALGSPLDILATGTDPIIRC